MTLPLIEFKNISKSYCNKLSENNLKERVIGLFKPTYTYSKVLDDISFNLYTGKSLAILGPNGAGKSTLIKILSGIQYADKGNVKVLGMDPYKNRKNLFKELGVVFGHKNCLWWDLPLRYSLEMVQPLYGLDKVTFNHDIKEITSLLNISHIMDKPVRLLSLGERVKSELAFNLSFRPKILFLDEPTIGLDITSKHEIRELLKRLKQENGIGYIITSHDMGDIDGYVDDIILLHKGEKKYHGDISSLKNMISSLVRVTLFYENSMEPSDVLLRVNEIAIKESIILENKKLNDENLSLEISLHRDAYPRFIQVLTTELNCVFSVSTPSLEEMLRVKFKEFN
ncbi:DNA repair protein [Pectobacterium brasiliense]|uniref:ATP-binding cassette domain-containing protein n=1 Tax=Pectobacterium brasiliense TaxID=180957 RepID=UPI0005809CDE|nr:ATP-binding cassette domain-containing protein [Pectobacterium brasiliense]KHS67091.1 DNA repair protein [Pectobacterium brasiliense]KHS87119.1 DNA repair protein [Pectobacterium brasiliense]